MASKKFEICPDYSSNPTKCTGKCSKLHICKFYLLSNSCRNSEKGTPCKYVHSLATPHNKTLLKNKQMDNISLEELRSLMQRTKGTKPPKQILCTFYNTTKGCSKDGTDKPCQFVHLCAHYVSGTCKFGNGCKRSHDIFDPKTIGLLEKNGLNTKRSTEEVLTDLRKRIALKTESNETKDAEDTLTHSESAKSIKSKSKQPMTERETDETSTEICIHYLKGKCRFETSCKKQHKNCMYQWQFREEGEKTWTDFTYSDNFELEKKYSDAQNEETTIFFNKKELLTVQLDLMVAEMRNGTSFKIRRLSTESSALHKFQPLATWWKWFYRNQDDKWTIYGAGKTKGEKSKNESNILEQCYQDNPNGQKVLSPGDHKIIIDFSSMLQIDLVQGTKMIIRRRPVFIHPKEAEKRKQGLGHKKKTDQAITSTPTAANSVDTPTNQETPSSNDSVYNQTKPKVLPENDAMSDVPIHWTLDRQKSLDELMDHIQMIECPSSNEEYDKIKNLFFVTMPTSTNIVQIKRIENGELWMNFSSKRTRMTKKTKTGNINELQLFHGTNEKFVEAICNQGFDFRFSGSKSGTAYGKGSYFAKRASYSDSYTDYGGKKYMFVVRVLAGEYTTGISSYVRPPPKSSSNQFDLYDSCVDNPQDPSIYIIFTNDQVYPEYIIEYIKS